MAVKTSQKGRLTPAEKERSFELYYLGWRAFLKDSPYQHPSNLSEEDAALWRLGYQEAREALEKLRSGASP